MTEENKTDEVEVAEEETVEAVEEEETAEEATDEQKQTVAWMNYVSDEVNTLLGLYLPISKSGTVGVKYNRAVTAMYESGPEYDPNKAEGVEIRLVFDFENVVDIPKEPAE